MKLYQLYRALVVSLLFIGFQVNAGSAQKYENGTNQSIARQGNLIVEVHSSGYFNTLWYRVGTIHGKKISWGESHEYGKGIHASIAIKGNTVIEVHESTPENNVWYRIGKLKAESKVIAWGTPQIMSQGHSPVVRMGTNTVLAVFQYTTRHLDHCTTDKEGKEHCYYNYLHDLYLKTGFLQNSMISWSNAYFYSRGKNPSIDVSRDVFVETHESDNSNDLFYRVGKLENGALYWTFTGSYGTGVKPSIAISGDHIVEMHRSPNFNRLWFHVGELDYHSHAIYWGKSYSYDRGTYPAIALDNQSLIETHTSDFFNSLYINFGVVDKDPKSIHWSN